MKYLNEYKLFESAGKLIPSDFVKLHSIGHVLDPKTGWIYPLYSNGIYYEDDNGLSIEWGDVSFDGINDKDMNFVDSLWKSVEPIIKDKIDFELIDKLKYLSLDAIDDGFTLYYSILVDSSLLKFKQRVSFGSFNHQFDHFVYSRKFPDNFKKVMDQRNDDLLYSFRLASRGNGYNINMESEILKTIKDMTGYNNIDITDY
jgi:hypothetical protein